jgi:hypothetical protein
MVIRHDHLHPHLDVLKHFAPFSLQAIIAHCTFWTADRSLAAVAQDLGVAMNFETEEKL